MKSRLLQAVVAAFILVLLISLSDPFMLVMPTQMVMLALLAATVLVCVWAAFILREEPGDEREALQRLHAGRTAYLVGVGVLTLGVIVEALTAHHVDIWLASTLGVMIVAKLVTRCVAEMH